ncbi:MAG: thioredoxin family protein, partial [Bacteroidota bacterium]
VLEEQSIEYGFVLFFICNHCPYVQAITSEIADVTTKLTASGIPTYAVMSNNYHFVTADSLPYMQSFAAEHQFTFPYLLDESQSVAREYGAVCTPDIFGFAADRSMQYRGCIEDLASAMEIIKDTGRGPESQRPSQGCSIKWK